MRVLGIVAEYNPFHNGHAYQIRKAKLLSGADRVVVVMSGNFVQRGAPAVLDKFKRTKMALENGADFVFEIPAVFAVSSAEYFAAAGVGLLDALGCVDVISFGCETPNLPLMDCIADVLTEEPDAYQKILYSFLKEGYSFPAARERAVAGCLQARELPDCGCSPEKAGEAAADLLGAPNNILALEYLKALKRSGSGIEPLPVLREGAGYHEDGLGEKYCSAAAIRKYLRSESFCSLTESASTEALADFMPESAAAVLTASDTVFLTEQDFSGMLYYRLLCERERGLKEYADCTEDLSNRILNALPTFRDYRGFCERLKSRDMTYSRISRVLLHALLGVTDMDPASGKSLGFAPYLRLLGFRRDAEALFSEIRAKAKCPLLTKPAKARELLSPEALSLFRKDVFASDLYYGVLAQKNNREQKTEYRREMVIL